MLIFRTELENEEGQALIEFLMLLPIILTFLWYQIHISSAINKSIVGQKHARSQLFHKLWNHRSGPVTQDFNTSDRSHFYLGVTAENYKDGTQPVAPTEILGIGISPKAAKESDDTPGEAKPNALRQKVRIRTVFGICTHRKTNTAGEVTDFCGSENSGP